MGHQEDKTAHAKAVIDKTRSVAVMAGFRPVANEDQTAFFVEIQWKDGRSQSARVSWSGQTRAGLDVITFGSPGMLLPKDADGDYVAAVSERLLRMNADTLFVRYAIDAWNEEFDAVIVCSDQIVSTMEVEEFQEHLLTVTETADDLEKQHDVDYF